jgi:hypothetical protein
MPSIGLFKGFLFSRIQITVKAGYHKGMPVDDPVSALQTLNATMTGSDRLFLRWLTTSCVSYSCSRPVG